VDAGSSSNDGGGGASDGHEEGKPQASIVNEYASVARTSMHDEAT